MSREHSFLEDLMQQNLLASETFPGLPIIEIAGEKRVLIENHQGVLAYGKEKIIAKVTYGSVCICGNNLELIHMTKDQLVICGRITTVMLQRRG